MASIEQTSEVIEVLLLEAQAALAGVQIVRFDDDDAAEADRIIVRSSPREIELETHRAGEARVWRVPVEVRVHMATDDEAQLDRYIVAIQAANSEEAPAEAVALAVANFLGLEIKDTDDGERDASADVRTRSKTFHFLIPAGEVEGVDVDTFLRPGGSFTFFRPDGTSQYLRAA